MQAPHEVVVGSAPLRTPAPAAACARTSAGSIGVGPLTSVVSGSAEGGGAFLSCPLPLPANAGETTRAAASVARRTAYRMASFPVLAGPPRRHRDGSVVNSDNQVALAAMPEQCGYKAKKCQ